MKGMVKSRSKLAIGRNYFIRVWIYLTLNFLVLRLRKIDIGGQRINKPGVRSKGFCQAQHFLQKFV